MASHHTPRRKRKTDGTLLSNPTHGTVDTDPATNAQRPAFPLVAFLWPAKGTVSQWVMLPLVLMVVGLFRWATGLWGYSGFQSPPMHGDFEAQRHWMEITTRLPVSQWYFHDLEWWGLDYPPLTAYHSWLLGKIGSYINPAWFDLYTSRGLDDPDLKVYMRATVFVSEYLIYVPAVIILLRRYARLQGVNTWEASIALVAILMQPSTLIVDHGHFQYNTVMLGLTLASISSMLASRPLWSCVYFVGALGFKQMALFYAPAVFIYLLGICIQPRLHSVRLLLIGLVTLASFLALYAPILLSIAYETYHGVDVRNLPAPPLLTSLLSKLPVEITPSSPIYPFLLQLTQSVHRIFPFARGLFEDKVANVWCAIHTFHKLHMYPQAVMSRLALLTTLAGITPPCLILLLKPRRELLPSAFAATAWAFFLCSYQVHEKNVLLPLVPMTLLLASDGGLLPTTRAWVGLANLLGVWTCFPLLKRDELRVPYFVLTGLWAYLLGLPPTSLQAYRRRDGPGAVNWLTTLAHLGLYAAMLGWHVVEAFVEPPRGKPDLWVVVNVLVGAAGFGLCYLWCVWDLVVRSGVWGGVQPTPSSSRKAAETEKKRQ